MRQKVTKLILPFAIPAEDRVMPFTKDMEMAAVFYLAESEREKGGGRIKKKPAEKLVFIAEACYPIWLAPWRGKTILFDGLGVTTHTFYYDTPPDTKAFDDDVQRSAETREAYSEVLSSNINFFQGFAGKEEKIVEGLITSPEFTQDLVAYLPEAEEIERPIVGKAFLSPNIDKSAITNSIEELSNLRAKLSNDIKDLSKSMKLLSSTTREQVKVVREEIREIKKKFDEKIASVKPDVTKRVQEIQRKLDAEIARISKNYERKLRFLHKDRIKLEKKHEQLNVEIERCEAEIKSCRLRKDEGGELQFSQKLKKARKNLPALQKGIQDMDRKIEDGETAKKLEISEVRSEYDTRIEKAMKNLRELEASREARIRMKQQEIKSLDDTTSAIVNQMNEMAKLKKAALNELDGIGAPRSRRNYELVYLPLYFSCYETEAKRRYAVYPPSIVGSMGLLTKFKGVFGVAKMKSFLQPRSKAMTSLLNQLVTLVQENPVFEKDLSDAGIQASIIQTTESRIGIKRGLEELKEEKWISESELQNFSELL